MVFPLLIIVVPVLVGIFCAFFVRKPVPIIAEWQIKFQSARRSVVVILMILGAFVAVSLDLLDLSEIISDRGTHLQGDIDLLKSDFETLFYLSGEKLESAENRLDQISKQIISPAPKAQVYILSGLLGITAGFYIFFSALQIGAEGVVAAKIRLLQIQLDKNQEMVRELQGKLQSAQAVFKQIEIIVVAKLERIDRALEGARPANTAERLEFCRMALAPNLQTHSFVLCAHKFFQRPELKTARLIVSLYIPSNGFLRVIASTDGNKQNVVHEPNDEFQENFSLESPMRKSEVVETYFRRTPKVVANCLESDFHFFRPDQKSEICSIFSCPLSFNTGPVLGVLFAESNEVNYFSEDETFQSLLVLMGDQLALRMTLEKSMDSLFEVLDDSVKKESE